MCTIFFAYQTQPDYHLIVVGNRDEFLDRPTRPAQFWDDHPELLAGQDLKQKGTWMGVTKTGRFATVTNYREPGKESPKALSRGELPINYLTGKKTPSLYLNQIRQTASDYNGYNLVIGDKNALWYFSNRENKIRQLRPDLYGLSNHLLDTRWPKVVMGQGFVKATLRLFENHKKEDRLIRTLIEIMRSDEKAAEGELPRTGLSVEKERELSPLFIKMDGYGTRTTTVILWRKDGSVRFVEHDHQGGVRNEFDFQIS